MILDITKVDIIIIVVVACLLILISTYLIVVYKNNPCGDCHNAKQCKATKKMAKSLLKNYKKCNKNSNNK